jgi:hypothetical protein
MSNCRLLLHPCTLFWKHGQQNICSCIVMGSCLDDSINNIVIDGQSLKTVMFCQNNTSSGQLCVVPRRGGRTGILLTSQYRAGQTSNKYRPSIVIRWVIFALDSLHNCGLGKLPTDLFGAALVGWRQSSLRQNVINRTHFCEQQF